jgi:hypothetical protein
MSNNKETWSVDFASLLRESIHDRINGLHASVLGHGLKIGQTQCNSPFPKCPDVFRIQLSFFVELNLAPYRLEWPKRIGTGSSIVSYHENEISTRQSSLKKGCDNCMNSGTQIYTKDPSQMLTDRCLLKRQQPIRFRNARSKCP